MHGRLTSEDEILVRFALRALVFEIQDPENQKCTEWPQTGVFASYFSNRKQWVKIGDVRSSWSVLRKGAPQGSVLEPFIFNCFQNDLLCSITSLVDIFNYADDNTIGVQVASTHDVLSQLKTACEYILMWFDQNCMQANAENFQLILFARQEVTSSLNIGGTVIHSEPVHCKTTGSFYQ